ncbi:MAG: hypothetical protein DRO18_02715 [Thermoprotei archaeon]|nr:MAG: hypothetical protein DRO18_02715 [Thermoprotei archaeon]
MRSRKLITIPLTLFMIAVIISASYAMWYEVLRMNAEVVTGIVDWEFVTGTIIQLDTCDFSVNDYNASFLPDPGAIQLDKDVGCTDVELEDSDGDGDYDTMIITMHNVYPWYYEHIAFKVHNSGTIPIKIWRVIINGEEYYELNEQELQQGIEIDVDGDGVPDVLIWWGDNFGEQLDPCQSADISLDLTILQGAPQNTTLTVEISFDAIQWNEYEEHLPPS